MMRKVLFLSSLILVWPGLLLGQEEFPAPEFRSGYQMPQLVVTPPFSHAWAYIDTAMLAGTLSLAAYLVFRKRSRNGVFALAVFSLLYFGFFRKGCICPIGAIQNVALAAGGHGYALPWVAGAFFLMPLAFALFYGRVFCSSVCPLGAIQDLVLWKPIEVPAWLEAALGLFAYLYLGLAVAFAATNSDFLICRYDPFVGFFRLSGPAHMLFIGGVLLVMCMFIGRTYCRFICPYSVLLKLLSPFSRRQVTISPEACVDCRLCETSCPFGAIRHPTPRDNSRHKDAGRRQLQLALAALPVLIGVFALIGYFSAPALSRRDFTVKQAERVWLEEKGLVSDVSDESKAFRERGLPVEVLYGQAAAIQKKVRIAATVFGGWVGLAIGLKLIGLIIRRRRDGYTADPGGCVACARCYLSCPVEHEQRQKQAEAVAV